MTMIATRPVNSSTPGKLSPSPVISQVGQEKNANNECEAILRQWIFFLRQIFVNIIVAFLFDCILRKRLVTGPVES